MDNANKTIARNTIYVYIRVLVTMFVGLLSSRYVLKALGESDFGLYSAVGSIITMVTFLLASLSLSTTRFLNFEKGRIDGNVNQVFNISLCIHILFSVIILITAEVIGIIYINSFLNVDINRIDDAIFVFQFSTIISCLSIIGSPFQSLFVIHEKFKLLAVIEIISNFLKLGLIYSLLFVPWDKLKLYTIFMGIVTLLSTLTCVIISCYKWPYYVKLSFNKDLNSYKKLLVFNGYNILSSGSLMLRNQGSIMLINYFFGTIVNAAYAIANSVQTYVTVFVGNFDSASAPQIMQNYASGEKNKAINITSRTCRICILLMCIVYFPLIVELNTILDIWLDNYPYGTDIFCRYTLGIAIISSTSGGLVQLIMAHGKIKLYQIQYAILYTLCVPIAFYMFKQGQSPYIIVILFIIADFISRIIQLFLLHKDIGLDIISFIRNTYLRPMVVFIVMTIFVEIYQCLNMQVYLMKLFGIMLTLLFTVVFVFFIGLNNSERDFLLKSVMKIRTYR